MTGYGRATVDTPGSGGQASSRLTVEVRSVNHRGFDLKIRLDEPDAYCDTEITRLVRSVVERGTVAVALHKSDQRGHAAQVALDIERIRTTYEALEQLRHETGISIPVDLATVASFLKGPGADSERGNRPQGEDFWRILQPAVEEALAGLVATRMSEGQALFTDLSNRSKTLEELVNRIATGVGAAPARFARRLEERLAALRDQPGFEPGRVAQEIALLAERLDVSEELVRLRTHLDHFRKLLGTAGAIGRKLDFVIQEMGREINTIGSKAQDAAVAALVIDAKAELEKIREQAQNIE